LKALQGTPQVDAPQVGKRPVGRPRKLRLINHLEPVELEVKAPSAAERMELKIPGSSAFRAIRDLMSIDPEMSLSSRLLESNRAQKQLVRLAEQDLVIGQEAMQLVRRLHRHMAAHPQLNLRALCVEVTKACPDTQGPSFEPGARFLRSLDLVDEFLHQHGTVPN